MINKLCGRLFVMDESGNVLAITDSPELAKALDIAKKGQVKVCLPGPLLAQLQLLADKHGTTKPAYLTELIRAHVTGDTKPRFAPRPKGLAAASPETRRNVQEQGTEAAARAKRNRKG